MKHPDWPAFLAAIVADPDDDTARLVAADFLEENGDPERAAFIRIQVKLARLEAAGEGKSLDADHLRLKERAYLGPLALDWKFWAAEECPEFVAMPSQSGGRDSLDGMAVKWAERVAYRRGFIERVRCPAQDWRSHGVAVRSRNPVRGVELDACDRMNRDDWYAALPALRGLDLVQVDTLAAGMSAWLQGWLDDCELVVGPRR
jgi:uncharacterized protein (TIGR02996 family)